MLTPLHRICLVCASLTAVLVTAFGDAPEAAACSFAPLDEHTIDPGEQQVDSQAPEAPVIASIEMRRNPSQGNGCTGADSCDGSGQIGIVIAAANDDRTPFAEIGYQIRIVRGDPSLNLFAPQEPVRPDANGVIWLLFSDDDQDIDVEIAVSAVDLAGNQSAPTLVDAVDETGGCQASVPGPPSWSYLVLFAAFVVVVRRRRA